MRKSEENMRDRLCFVSNKKSICSALVLGRHTSLIQCSIPFLALSSLPASLTYLDGIRDFPYSAVTESCYPLLRRSTPSRSTAHGMGYPSTRRDRPELRNQLVRQRRALVLQAHPCSSRSSERLLLRLPFISFGSARSGSLRLFCVYAH